MRGRGRRDMARTIGRRRHHRLAERGQETARHLVARHAHRDRVEPRGGKLGHRAARRFRQNQRQRAGPQRGQTLGIGIEQR